MLCARERYSDNSFSFSARMNANWYFYSTATEFTHDDTLLPQAWEAEKHVYRTRREAIENILRHKCLFGSVPGLCGIILDFLPPSAVFRYQVVSTDGLLQHEALVLWDDGTVQCESARDRWWWRRSAWPWDAKNGEALGNSPCAASLQVLAPMLRGFPSAPTTVQCPGGPILYSRWQNFRARVSLPRFRRDVAIVGPNIDMLASSNCTRERDLHKLHHMALSYARSCRGELLPGSREANTNKVHIHHTPRVLLHGVELTVLLRQLRGSPRHPFVTEQASDPLSQLIRAGLSEAKCLLSEFVSTSEMDEAMIAIRRRVICLLYSRQGPDGPAEADLICDMASFGVQQRSRVNFRM